MPSSIRFKAVRQFQITGLCVWTALLLSVCGNAEAGAPSAEVQEVLDNYVTAWNSRNPFQLMSLAPVGSRVFAPLLSSERFDQCRESHVLLKDIEVDERDGGKQVEVSFAKVQEDLFWLGTITRGHARIQMTLRKLDKGYQITRHQIDDKRNEEEYGDVYVSSNPGTWGPGKLRAEKQFFLAYQKVMLGRFEEAKALFEPLVNLDPKQSGLDKVEYALGTNVFVAQIHYFLGLCEKKLGNLPQWRARMKRAREIHQAFPLVLNEIAMDNAEKGNLVAALEQWRLSLDLAPNQNGVLARIDFYQGALNYPAGEHRDLYLQTLGIPPAQAIEILGQLLVLTPNHVETRQRLATAHLLNYDPASAEKHLKVCQFLLPGDTETEYLLGRVYMSQSRFDDAFKQFQIVWNTLPDYRDCLVYLSEISSMKRRYRQALSYLQEALLLRPKDPVLLYKLGVYSLKLGDRFGAMAFLRQAMEAGPPEYIRQDLYERLMEI